MFIIFLLIVVTALVYKYSSGLLPKMVGKHGSNNIKIIDRLHIGYQQQIMVIEYQQQQFMVLNTKTTSQLQPLSINHVTNTSKANNSNHKNNKSFKQMVNNG
ncbi:MAG: flagellar biosynthetic protein FliO [Pseudomonadota bacterium]